MQIPDTINGAFELTGGLLCWLNVRRLLRDRKVEGVDWRVSAFFSAWGLWNLFYYPSLQQWASFAGGLLLVLANMTWVVLALRTIKQQSWRNHIRNHKAYDPNCAHCREAINGLTEDVSTAVFNMLSIPDAVDREAMRALAEELCPDFFEELNKGKSLDEQEEKS